MEPDFIEEQMKSIFTSKSFSLAYFIFFCLLVSTKGCRTNSDCANTTLKICCYSECVQYWRCRKSSTKATPSPQERRKAMGTYFTVNPNGTFNQITPSGINDRTGSNRKTVHTKSYGTNDHTDSNGIKDHTDSYERDDSTEIDLIIDHTLFDYDYSNYIVYYILPLIFFIPVILAICYCRILGKCKARLEESRSQISSNAEARDIEERHDEEREGGEGGPSSSIIVDEPPSYELACPSRAHATPPPLYHQVNDDCPLPRYKDVVVHINNSSLNTSYRV